MDSTLSFENEKMNQKINITNDSLRKQILESSKHFKTFWVELGQALYTVWKDKLYYAWGYERFEYYIQKEVGLKKELSLKLLKAYYFLEQNEPEYLNKNFSETRPAANIPGYEAIDVLRLAKAKKELSRDDYTNLKKEIFQKGKEASLVRKDLTALIKERKQLDPETEREKRNEAAIRRLVNSLRSFEKDMEALKLVPDGIVKGAKELLSQLKTQLPQTQNP